MFGKLFLKKWLIFESGTLFFRNLFGSIESNRQYFSYETLHKVEKELTFSHKAIKDRDSFRSFRLCYIGLRKAAQNPINSGLVDFEQVAVTQNLLKRFEPLLVVCQHISFRDFTFEFYLGFNTVWLGFLIVEHLMSNGFLLGSIQL